MNTSLTCISQEKYFIPEHTLSFGIWLCFSTGRFPSKYPEIHDSQLLFIRWKQKQFLQLEMKFIEMPRLILLSTGQIKVKGIRKLKNN